MFDSDDRLGDSIHFLWWAGWRPIHSIVIGLVVGGIFVGLTETAEPLGIGLLGGVIWWFGGTRYVNSNYSEVMRQYGRYTERAAQNHLQTVGEHTRSYTLTYSKGGAFFVEPAKRYYSTTLIVGETSVSVHEGVGIDMVSRIPYLNDDTREIYYDQIASVSYSRPMLTITTSNGGTLEYQSSREPNDALADLQNRLREYKTQSRA